MAETIVGVDLGGTKVSVGAVSSGVVRNEVRREVPSREAAEVVFDEIAGTTDSSKTSSIAPAISSNLFGRVMGRSSSWTLASAFCAAPSTAA